MAPDPGTSTSPEPAPAAPEPDRLHWSPAERRMAVLIAILFALVATWTARSRDRTQALEATRKALDEVVAAVDEARRKTRHDPGGPVEAIFLGDRIDAWGRPLQVDPGKAIVYSLGPDGLDQRGEGDDLVRYLPSLARSR